MRKLRILIAGFAVFTLVAVPRQAAAQGLSPAAQRGLTLIRTHCAGCHAIDRVSESPLKIAPPLRTLPAKYPLETLRTPLREGVLTGHPTMPVFRLDPDQVEDILAYLRTLER
jgi:mono/diheme cytochrome c family protein